MFLPQITRKQFHRGLISLTLLLGVFRASGAVAAESKPIALHATERSFQRFLVSLKTAAKKKDASAVHAFLAQDYYLARDFGGAFDPAASPAENFSWTFQFDNDRLSPEFRDNGWHEFQEAISGMKFEKKRDGQLCVPYGALDTKPFPHSQLCFRKFRDGWKIQGYINGGD